MYFLAFIHFCCLKKLEQSSNVCITESVQKIIYTIASFDLEMLIFGGPFSYDMNKWLYTYSQEIAKNLLFLLFIVLKADKMKRGFVSIIS